MGRADGREGGQAAVPAEQDSGPGAGRAQQEGAPPADPAAPGVHVAFDAFVDVQLAVPRLSPLPPLDGSLEGWPDAALLPDLSGLHDQRAFARVWAGWTVQGLALAFDVHLAHPIHSDPERPGRSDGVEVWCDTRDSRLARKPTRYCHQFLIWSSRQKRPYISVLHLGGDAQTGQATDAEHIRAAMRVPQGPPRGYALEVFLPRAVLAGYAPLEYPSVALGYRVRSSDGALQDLAFGERFPLWRNPSLWRSVRLEGAAGP